MRSDDVPLLLGDVCRILQLPEREVDRLEARDTLHARRTPSGLRIFSQRQVEMVAKKLDERCAP